MLRVAALRKEFPKVVAVDDLTFNIERGIVCGFVGPNGAGKTTTMRMIATLEVPTDGEIWVDGISIYRDPYAVRRRIGFMPDHLGVYPDMLVEDYLEFYARAYELPTATRRARLADILEFTELTRVAGKKVETLSKGWRQRLNMGRALVNDPALLVMDEPAAGLDPRARIELRLLIRALADRGKAIFISSHILTELSEICDDMIIIQKGRLRIEGNIQQIRKQSREGHIVRVQLLGAPEFAQIEKWFLERPGISQVSQRPDGMIEFMCGGSDAELAQLLSAMIADGFRVVQWRIEASTMEELFLQLTEEGEETEE
jgi:ABC-2 type transport system ATP-binding protein